MTGMRTFEPAGSPGHRHEMELFQSTARTTLSTEAARRVDELLTGRLDWHYVLSAGGLHGILPLMSLHLGGREAVPQHVRSELRGRCERVVRSNLYKSAQLIEIVDALAEADVSAVVLKGPVVAMTVYGDLGLREFGDLDVLVTSEDVARATRVVESLGFMPWRRVHGAQTELLQHVEYSRTFTRPADDLDLDLHWDLARSFFRGRIEAKALWQDTRSFELHGRELRCLSSELLLLALCVHGAKHGPFPWPRLKWICDVAEFVRRSEGHDWEATKQRARDLDCRRTALLGLALSRPLLDTALPAAIERELATEPRLADLAFRIWALLASDTPVSVSFRERFAMDLTVIDDGGGRLSYAVRRILTPTGRDWKSRNLPRHLAFLYVPLRVVRLASHYVPRPWKLRQLLRAGPRRSGGDAPADEPADRGPQP